MDRSRASSLVSTCAGAPAPHENCPHGDACDWTPDPLDELRGMKDSGISLVDRVKSTLERRKTRTPSRALAEIEKLETEDVAELGIPVFVWREHRGRATGHAVGCEDHGVMPFLAPTQGKAILAAARHIKTEHGYAGSVVLVPKAPRLKIRAAS